jgi:hypothetical protein
MLNVNSLNQTQLSLIKNAYTEKSGQQAMSKSQNKHNRLHGTSEPLHEKIPELIENG